MSSSLERLTGLKELNLSNTTVSDAGLAKLAGLSQLQILRIAGTLVEGRGLGQLTGLKELRELDQFEHAERLVRLTKARIHARKAPPQRK